MTTIADFLQPYRSDPNQHFVTLDARYKYEMGLGGQALALTNYIKNDPVFGAFLAISLQYQGGSAQLVLADTISEVVTLLGYADNVEALITNISTISADTYAKVLNAIPDIGFSSLQRIPVGVLQTPMMALNIAYRFNDVNYTVLTRLVLAILAEKIGAHRRQWPTPDENDCDKCVRFVRGKLADWMYGNLTIGELSISYPEINYAHMTCIVYLDGEGLMMWEPQTNTIMPLGAVPIPAPGATYTVPNFGEF